MNQKLQQNMKYHMSYGPPFCNGRCSNDRSIRLNLLLKIVSRLIIDMYVKSIECVMLSHKYVYAAFSVINTNKR